MAIGRRAPSAPKIDTEADIDLKLRSANDLNGGGEVVRPPPSDGDAVADGVVGGLWIGTDWSGPA